MNGGCVPPALAGIRPLRSTDLALRLLARLAVGDGSSSPTTRAVAAETGVPYTPDAKVVARLRHRGRVDARRGIRIGHDGCRCEQARWVAEQYT